MSSLLATLVDLLMKSAIVAFILNEVRGAILAVPVLYGMYQAGGTLMAIWIGFCSLAGIGLSVVVPLVIDKKYRLRERLLARVKPA